MILKLFGDKNKLFVQHIVNYKKAVLVSGVVLMGASCSDPVEESHPPVNSPNIIIVFTDDQGYTD